MTADAAAAAAVAHSAIERNNVATFVASHIAFVVVDNMQYICMEFIKIHVNCVADNFRYRQGGQLTQAVRTICCCQPIVCVLVCRRGCGGVCKQLGVDL